MPAEGSEGEQLSKQEILAALRATGQGDCSLRLPEGLTGLDGQIADAIRGIKGLEDRARQRTAELDASLEELEAFSYSVSHDLRAPLRHISGFVELLTKKLTDNPDEGVQHYMALIGKASVRMGRLMDDLLDFSRMGRLEMQQKPVDMDEVARDVIRELEERCRGREVRWTVARLPQVRGSVPMLRQVVANLLANAVKFTGTRALAEISITCAEEGHQFIFSVQDNGVGFDMKYVDKLFGVFKRLHSQEEFEGTGIGLASVRRILARHGGKAWAEGAPGAGATFFFSLPRRMEA